MATPPPPIPILTRVRSLFTTGVNTPFEFDHQTIATGITFPSPLCLRFVDPHIEQQYQHHALLECRLIVVEVGAFLSCAIVVTVWIDTANGSCFKIDYAANLLAAVFLVLAIVTHPKPKRPPPRKNTAPAVPVKSAETLPERTDDAPSLSVIVNAEVKDTHPHPTVDTAGAPFTSVGTNTNFLSANTYGTGRSPIPISLSTSSLSLPDFGPESPDRDLFSKLATKHAHSVNPPRRPVGAGPSRRPSLDLMFAPSTRVSATRRVSAASKASGKAASRGGASSRRSVVHAAAAGRSKMSMGSSTGGVSRLSVETAGGGGGVATARTSASAVEEVPAEEAEAGEAGPEHQMGTASVAGESGRSTSLPGSSPGGSVLGSPAAPLIVKVPTIVRKKDSIRRTTSLVRHDSVRASSVRRHDSVHKTSVARHDSVRAATQDSARTVPHLDASSSFTLDPTLTSTLRSPPLLPPVPHASSPDTPSSPTPSSSTVPASSTASTPAASARVLTPIFLLLFLLCSLPLPDLLVMLRSHAAWYPDPPPVPWQPEDLRVWSTFMVRRPGLCGPPVLPSGAGVTVGAEVVGVLAEATGSKQGADEAVERMLYGSAAGGVFSVVAITMFYVMSATPIRKTFWLVPALIIVDLLLAFVCDRLFQGFFLRQSLFRFGHSYLFVYASSVAVASLNEHHMRQSFLRRRLGRFQHRRGPGDEHMEVVPRRALFPEKGSNADASDTHSAAVHPTPSSNSNSTTTNPKPKKLSPTTPSPPSPPRPSTGPDLALLAHRFRRRKRHPFLRALLDALLIRQWPAPTEAQYRRFHARLHRQAYAFNVGIMVVSAATSLWVMSEIGAGTMMEQERVYLAYLVGVGVASVACCWVMVGWWTVFAQMVAAGTFTSITLFTIFMVDLYMQQNILGIYDQRYVIMVRILLGQALVFGDTRYLRTWSALLAWVVITCLSTAVGGAWVRKSYALA
ncbi:hypothetical protein HDU96_002361, partial [Phlyctochytrium bullatum]